MRRIDYDDRQHRVYHAGRRHPELTVQQWRDLLATHAGQPALRRWLDVGAGTGRFSVLLAELFAAEVIGIEPSSRMREEAHAHNAHARITYLPGSAEQIPRPDASFDGALMSMVYHHLRDPVAATRELRRVLVPGARVFVRNALREQHLESTFYGFFEAARRIDHERLPTLAAVRACFADAGFFERHHELVHQVTDTTLEAFEARMRTRPFSTFELMSEAEIEAGFQRLAAAVAEDGSRPAIECVDLLVLEAR